MLATERLPLTMPEIRRQILLRASSPEERERQQRWSPFRQAQQVKARRSHMARRALTLLSEPVAGAARTSALLLAGTVTLAERAWQAIAPLLPRLQRAPKRAIYAHRRVLEGILWVMQTGRAWREVPEAFGPWHTVYQRYWLWRQRDIWEQIRCLLHPNARGCPFLS
jgi:hypothetical protein